MYDSNAIASVLFDTLGSHETGEYLKASARKNDEVAEFFQKLNEAMEDGILEKIMMALIQNGGNTDVKRS